MKKKITIGILALGLLAMSFRMAVDKQNATVQSVDGVQIFIFSKPTAKYDVSGNIKEATFTSSDNEKRIKNLVERAKEKYPSVEGLIITNTLKNAEAIRFKD